MSGWTSSGSWRGRCWGPWYSWEYCGTSRQQRQRLRGESASTNDFALRMEMHDGDREPDESLWKFLHSMLATLAAVAGVTVIVLDSAEAYEQAYPLKLQSTPYGDVETSVNSLSKLKEERLSNKKAKAAATKSELTNDPLGLSTNVGLTIAGTSTWAIQ